MNTDFILPLIVKVIIGIIILTGMMSILALWVSKRSSKARTEKIKKTEARVASKTTTSPEPQPAPAATPTPSVTSVAGSTEEKIRSQILARRISNFGILWTIVIASAYLWYNPEHWRWVGVIAAVVVTILMIFINPHLPKLEEKEKKDTKDRYTIGKFFGQTIRFLFWALIWLIILGIGYLWIFLPAWEKTYGVAPMQKAKSTFPYTITIPLSPDPTGAYSAPLIFPEGGRVEFDWKKFPKDVWVDICWNGERVTRMRPVNDPLWKQPWGTNIYTMEFKAVIAPTGINSVDLGYKFK